MYKYVLNWRRLELIMLLCEILNSETFDEAAYNTLTSATMGTGHSKDANMNVVVNTLLKRYPTLGYTGSMFRVVGFYAKEFLQFKGNKDVLAAIKNYKIPVDRGSRREAVSWSKTVTGVSNFLNMSRTYGGDDYEEHNSDTIVIYVVLHQRSMGLDVGKALKFLSTKLKKPHNNMAGSVGEILAPVESNVSIKLYHVIGLGDPLNDEEDIEDTLSDTNSGTDDSWAKHARSLRWEADTKVRPDQFSQLIDQVRHEYTTNTRWAGKRSKALHKSSPLRKYKINTHPDYYG